MTKINWFSKTILVPWYYVWIPVIIITVLVLIIAHLLIINQHYICHECGEVFKPGKFEFSSWLHVNDSRLMRCPKCGHKGFCPKKNI